MGKLFLGYPLIQHKLTLIRDKADGAKGFPRPARRGLHAHGLRGHAGSALKEVTIETPVSRATAYALSGKKLGVRPILRAGLGMVNGILKLVPRARVGHVGLYAIPIRLEPVKYLLQTARRCERAGDHRRRSHAGHQGRRRRRPRSVSEGPGLHQHHAHVSLLAASEGIERVRAAHGDIDLFVAAVDERLNDRGYIVPGMGDAGDRLFGTR